MIEQVYFRVQLPFPDRKIQFFTDGNDDYTYVLPKYYAETCMDYGQLVKIKERGTLVRKEKRIVYGTPGLEDIETTNIENFNGICRERCGRIVRKTKCFSKRRSFLKSAMTVLHFHWNFINNYQRISTPAMLEGLTNHPWTWEHFFYHRLTIIN